MQEFDLFVIGAGSGGVRCARIAAQNGANVAIVERQHWGGTCVNLGCVPKKLMVYASEMGQSLKDAPSYGWDVHINGHDWAHFIEAKDKEIARLNGVYVSLLKRAGVTSFTGNARLKAGNIIEITPSPLEPDAPTLTVKAKKIVLATGSTPVRLDIPGAEHALVSDDVFSLKERPQHIAIIGSGYIGLEFASIFNNLGSDVELVYRQNLPLRGFDTDLREHMHALIDMKGIVQHVETTPKKIEKTDAGLELTLSTGKVLKVDAVLMATGRRPAIDELGLEEAGIETDKGAVKTDSSFATSVPSIYAIGDITNQYNLTPTAIAEGHLLAEALFNPQGRDWSFETTPKAVFFSPPMASVGLTEQEAVKQHDLEIYSSQFTPMAQTLPGRPGKIFMKLIVDARSGVLLGAHMIGPDAPEIIQMLAIAVTASLTKAELDRTLSLHPTSAEEFVTMRTPDRKVPRAKASTSSGEAP
ncbi:glutathione-disulfide reductase [Aristophania vespae]|uniref:glutathione-disulfide reductase n=1 Tax=Aristophania vespae TaxID=2697033 RepID=UPI0023512AC2|nr:glutathione-disulfide reductase [Aristophania vespae]UMM64560.1 Glutathione amide reductase [Aristophania vespae]